MALTPTPEQAHTQERFLTGRNLTVEALAGSGKTTTLKQLARAGSGKRMLYTSFAASVIRDAKASFPRNVRASTTHGLAFGTVGRAYSDAGRLGQRLTPRLLLDAFGWTEGTFGGLPPAEGARAVLGTLTSFCQSSDPGLAAHHVPAPANPGTEGAAQHQAAAGNILLAANKVWEHWLSSDSDLPITHDTYLKIWALQRPKLPYEVFFLDEAQDTNDLAIGLLLDQDHGQRVIVGDRYQQIYSWRGAVNAMTRFQTDETCHLTQSFRFGNAIADAANAVLAGHLKADIRIRGWGDDSRLEEINKPPVIVSRTNALLIASMVAQLEEHPNSRIAVVGGVDELIRLMQGAEALTFGSRPACADLAGFESWDEVREYSESSIGQDLRVLVRLVDAYGTHAMISGLQRVQGHEQREEDADLILSTGHKAKGREWPRVQLADDFRAPPQEGSEESATPWTPEDANLLYVAVTRAREVLDVSACSAWQDALLRAGDAAIPQSPGTPEPLRLSEHAAQYVREWQQMHPGQSENDAIIALLNDAYPDVASAPATSTPAAGP